MKEKNDLSVPPRRAAKPVVSVLVAGGIVDSHADFLEAILYEYVGDQYDLRIMATDNAVELLGLAQERPFDLFVVILNNIWQGLNDVRLDPPDGGTWGERLSLITRLKRQFGKPIIAMSALEETGFAERAKRAGADAYFLLPFGIESFVAAVQACLKIQSETARTGEIAAWPGRTRPPRVVILDDEESLREGYSMLLRSSYEGAEILEFGDARDAWVELSRTAPDLFITDIHHCFITCREMLTWLAERRVKYPILVISAGLSLYPEDGRHAWGANLNVSFMNKPFGVEEFRTTVEAALQIPARRSPEHSQAAVETVPKIPGGTTSAAKTQAQPHRERPAGEGAEALYQKDCAGCDCNVVQPDYAEALRQYREAAEEGDADAQTILGWCYENGHGIPKDCEQAVHWYRRAAEQGHPLAQSNLAVCYWAGRGVPQDYELALHWLRKAVVQGYPLAQFNLGCAYRKGHGVQQDYAEAARWYRKAAEQGHPAAQINLGWCCENGHGVPRDYEQAAHWLRKAAEQGHPVGQCGLGECYYKGRGVPQDYKQAVRWFRKAVEQGHPLAQYNLGVCYHKGHGVQRNLPEAYKWFKLAADQAHANAQRGLASLSTLLSAAELAEGERLYEECMKRKRL